MKVNKSKTKLQRGIALWECLLVIIVGGIMIDGVWHIYTYAKRQCEQWKAAKEKAIKEASDESTNNMYFIGALNTPIRSNSIYVLEGSFNFCEWSNLMVITNLNGMQMGDTNFPTMQYYRVRVITP
jgi:hypothetical protein